MNAYTGAPSGSAPYGFAAATPVQPVAQPMVVNNVIAPPVIASQKSTGVAFLLTFFFGPFGLFYSSVTGGLVMTLVGIPLSIVTFGVAGIFVWIGSIIWGCVAADSYNRRMGVVPAVMMAPAPVVQPTPVFAPVPPAPAPAPPPASAPAPVSGDALAIGPATEAGWSSDIAPAQTCPSCAAPLREGAEFCTGCGTRRAVPVLVEGPEVVSRPNATVIVERCPAGHVVDESSKFCPQCGTPLTGA